MIEPPPRKPVPIAESAKPPEVTSVPCNAPGLDATMEVWPRVLAACEQKASLHAIVEKLWLVSLSPQRAVVGHTPRDKHTALMSIEHLKAIFTQVLGSPIVVLLQQVESAPASTKTHEPQGDTSPAAEPEQPTPRATTKAIDEQAAADHPLVKRAAELLNGKITRIQPRPPKAE